MHSLIRGLLSTILLLALSQQAASQSVIVTTSFSQAITFTGNRVLATVSVPIPITVTVGGASAAGTTGAASNAGGTVVTVGGSSQSGAPVSNGGVVTVGASQAASASASSKPTTTYPAAPATTVDPNSVAPYPGQTNAAGQVLGPDDSYHAAGFRTVETGVALVGTLAAIVVGGAQLIHLL